MDPDPCPPPTAHRSFLTEGSLSLSPAPAGPPVHEPDPPQSVANPLLTSPTPRKNQSRSFPNQSLSVKPSSLLQPASPPAPSLPPLSPPSAPGSSLSSPLPLRRCRSPAAVSWQGVEVCRRAGCRRACHEVTRGGLRTEGGSDEGRAGPSLRAPLPPPQSAGLSREKMADRAEMFSLSTFHSLSPPGCRYALRRPGPWQALISSQPPPRPSPQPPPTRPCHPTPIAFGDPSPSPLSVPKASDFCSPSSFPSGPLFLSYPHPPSPALMTAPPPPHIPLGSSAAPSRGS